MSCDSCSSSAFYFLAIRWTTLLKNYEKGSRRPCRPINKLLQLPLCSGNLIFSPPTQKESLDKHAFSKGLYKFLKTQWQGETLAIGDSKLGHQGQVGNQLFNNEADFAELMRGRRLPLSRILRMEELRHTDAKVYAATHPGVRARGHMNRCNPRLRWKLSNYNPMNRLRLAKYKKRHPVKFQEARARSRFEYMNPLTYIRRIQHNLTHAGRRDHTHTATHYWFPNALTFITKSVVD